VALIPNCPKPKRAHNVRKVFQSRAVAEGKAYLMHLIVEDWRSPPVVVTVYRTSKIEKYWIKT